MLGLRLRRPGEDFAELASGFFTVAEVDVDDVIRPTHAEGLWLLTAGYCDIDAIHALATEQMQPVFDKLRGEYDFIIIDGAPVLGMTDALIPGCTAGLVVDYARAIGASVLLRGVRGATDAQFETGLAQTNRALAPDLSTLFLPAEAHLAQVSSSALKERLERGEDISAFCPAAVADKLRQRLLEPRSQP